ncbi:death domain-containing protein CRADD-like [Pelodytes ibericus]
MDPKHKQLLKSLRLELCAEGLAEGLVPQYLLQEGIITEDQLEEICSQTTTQRRTMKLLDILPTRGPRAFEIFLKSLSEFPWVKDKLEQLCNELVEHTVAQKTELPESVRYNRPTDKQLNILAGKLGAEWEQILINLGLEHNQLYRCKSNHPYNVCGQVMEALVMWRQQMGSNATMQCLWEALELADVDPSVMQHLG